MFEIKRTNLSNENVLIYLEKEYPSHTIFIYNDKLNCMIFGLITQDITFTYKKKLITLHVGESFICDRLPKELQTNSILYHLISAKEINQIEKFIDVTKKLGFT
jgi:hypothetical protein